jgi:hypothetical protein
MHELFGCKQKQNFDCVIMVRLRVTSFHFRYGNRRNLAYISGSVNLRFCRTERYLSRVECFGYPLHDRVNLRFCRTERYNWRRVAGANHTMPHLGQCVFPVLGTRQATQTSSCTWDVVEE